MTDGLTRYRKFLDRSRRLIDGCLVEEKKAASLAIRRIVREHKMKGKGADHSSAAVNAVLRRYEQEMRSRAEIALDSIQETHKAYGLPIAETLATDLKEEVNRHIEAVTKEASEFMTKPWPYAKPYVYRLETMEHEVKEKLDVEINIYCDSLLHGQAGTEPNGSSIVGVEEDPEEPPKASETQGVEKHLKSVQPPEEKGIMANKEIEQNITGIIAECREWIDDPAPPYPFKDLVFIDALGGGTIHYGTTCNSEAERLAMTRSLDRIDPVLAYLHNHHPGAEMRGRECLSTIIKRLESVRRLEDAGRPRHQCLCETMQAVRQFIVMLEDVQATLKANDEIQDPPEEVKVNCAVKIYKLLDFLKLRCEPADYPKSIKDRIHRLAKKNKFPMPKPINAEAGERVTKLYRESDLTEVWPEIKKVINNLPNIT